MVFQRLRSGKSFIIASKQIRRHTPHSIKPPPNVGEITRPLTQHHAAYGISV
ncbi:hypothetical protein BBAG_0571 [Bifidobacterium angulatum DSM 20098 = JCM 7096]|nr:hypothetical protein BBAG_0571 [Bifidobacterium angulatum DSM 20098 = JCM 7096]